MAGSGEISLSHMFCLSCCFSNAYQDFIVTDAIRKAFSMSVNTFQGKAAEISGDWEILA